MAKAKNKSRGHRVPGLTPIEMMNIAIAYDEGLTFTAADVSVLAGFINALVQRVHESEAMLDTLVARSPSHQSFARH